jgi:hypothetical protein
MHCEHPQRCYNFPMNTQKGFVSILFILLGLVIIGGGVYFYNQKNNLGIFDKKENIEISTSDEEKNSFKEIIMEQTQNNLSGDFLVYKRVSGVSEKGWKIYDIYLASLDGQKKIPLIKNTSQDLLLIPNTKNIIMIDYENVSMYLFSMENFEKTLLFKGSDYSINTFGDGIPGEKNALSLSGNLISFSAQKIKNGSENNLSKGFQNHSSVYVLDLNGKKEPKLIYTDPEDRHLETVGWWRDEIIYLRTHRHTDAPPGPIFSIDLNGKILQENITMNEKDEKKNGYSIKIDENTNNIEKDKLYSVSINGIKIDSFDSKDLPWYSGPSVFEVVGFVNF